MLHGGIIMDVVTPEQPCIAEEASTCAVMVLERVPADIHHPDFVDLHLSFSLPSSNPVHLFHRRRTTTMTLSLLWPPQEWTNATLSQPPKIRNGKVWPIEVDFEKPYHTPFSAVTHLCSW